MINSKDCLIGFLVFFSLYIHSSTDEYIRLIRPVSFSDYGTVGLLNMPSARMMQEGSLAFHWSGADPYLRGSIVATPFSWFEALYKYTDINDLQYSNVKAFSGGQSLKDKGFDAKFVVYKETDYFPQVAVGFRDLGGTNRFAAEYLVATKMINNFDITLGVGWGTLAGQNNFSNPLKQIHDTFEIRGNSGEQGNSGDFSPDAWFSGDKSSIFGGFEYFPSFSSKLRFKAEYDSTNYDIEGERPIPQEHPINVGLNYSLNNAASVHLGYIRGNTLQFGFTLSGIFSGRDPYKNKRDPIIFEEPRRASIIKDRIAARNERALYLASLDRLKQNEIYIQSAEITDSEFHIVYSQKKHQHALRATGRAAQLVNQLANDEIDTFKFSYLNGPMLLHTLEIDRHYLQQTLNDRDYQTLKYVSNLSQDSFDWEDMEYVPKAIFPVTEWGVTPAVRSHIGGPDGFWFGEFYIRGDAKVMFNRNLQVTAMASFGLWDNFKELKLPSDSILPHVRTDIVDYLKEGAGFNITRLQLDYLANPRKNIYTKLSAGIFEEMFAGYGGEILYRKFNSPFAIGLEVFDAYQRGYDQKFELRDYNIVTGHLSAYYNHSPSGVLFTLKGGRFLAGDSGLTFDFSRRFRSGFYVGAFITKTDISAEEFGEGSFDKGFYFSFPIDIFLNTYSAGRTAFGLKPLTRDGGASIIAGSSLYGITDSGSHDNLFEQWDTFYD